MEKRRNICFTISHCHKNASYEGNPESLMKFDELAKKMGSSRSRILSMFVEACAKADKLLLPQFSSENEIYEKKEDESIDNTKDKMRFVQYNGTISTK